MTRRWTLLVGALALSLSVPQAALATTQPTARPAAPAPGPDAAAADALAELRDDAQGPVRVQRDTEGEVAFVSSTDGEAMVEAESSTPRRAAQEQLATYGDAFGIDGDTSKAVVSQTVDSVDRRLRRPHRAGRRRRPRVRRAGRAEPRRGPGTGLGHLRDHRRRPGAGRADHRAAGAGERPAVRRAHPPAWAPTTSTSESVGRRLFDPALAQSTDPRGRAAGLAVPGDQRRGRPGDRAGRHRAWRDRPALQRGARHQPAHLQQQQRPDGAGEPARPGLQQRDGGARRGRRRLVGRRRQRRLRQPRRHLDRLRRPRRHRPDRDHRRRGSAGSRMLVSTVRWCFADTPGQAPDHAATTPTRSGTAPRWSSAPGTPRPTTWWGTSSRTATSSAPPTSSTCTRAVRSTSRSPTRSARSWTTATRPAPTVTTTGWSARTCRATTRCAA